MSCVKTGLGGQNGVLSQQGGENCTAKSKVKYSVECPWECMGDVLEGQESERLSFNG